MEVSITPHSLGDRSTVHSRIRFVRIQRHLATAALACVLWVMTGPFVFGFAELLTLAAFIGIVLGSLARAVDAFLGHWWGWLYGEPVYSTRLDLFVDSIVRNLAAVQIRRSSSHDPAIDVDDSNSRIRIIPLERERG